MKGNPQKFIRCLARRGGATHARTQPPQRGAPRHAHPVWLRLGFLRRLLQRNHLRRRAARQRPQRAVHAGRRPGKQHSVTMQPAGGAARGSHQVEHVVLLKQPVLGRSLLGQVLLQRRDGGGYLQSHGRRPAAVSGRSSAKTSAPRTSRTCAASSGDGPADLAACAGSEPGAILAFILLPYDAHCARRSQRACWRLNKKPSAAAAPRLSYTLVAPSTAHGCDRRAVPSPLAAPAVRLRVRAGVGNGLILTLRPLPGLFGGISAQARCERWSQRSDHECYRRSCRGPGAGAPLRQRAR